MHGLLGMLVDTDACFFLEVLDPVGSAVAVGVEVFCCRREPQVEVVEGWVAWIL